MEFPVLSIKRGCCGDRALLLTNSSIDSLCCCVLFCLFLQHWIAHIPHFSLFSFWLAVTTAHSFMFGVAKMHVARLFVRSWVCPRIPFACNNKIKEKNIKTHLTWILLARIKSQTTRIERHDFFCIYKHVVLFVHKQKPLNDRGRRPGSKNHK